MKTLICSNCGTLDNFKRQRAGSFFIELFLWLCFIFPGFLYSVWRISNMKNTCRSCGSNSAIPAESPRGKALLNG